jgi:cation diffusion facilitator CzcD-associated flavoprotein CzcO
VTVVVVGAGVSGLTTGVALLEAGFPPPQKQLMISRQGDRSWPHRSRPEG